MPPHSSLLKFALSIDTTRTLLAVFFAEQSHGAGLQRLIEIHDVGVNVAIRENLFVHQPLDFGEFVGVHRGVVREIEAQAPRLDDAAGLLHMRPENLSQRGMQQVRGRMIAHRRATGVSVNTSDDRLAGAGRADPRHQFDLVKPFPGGRVQVFSTVATISPVALEMSTPVSPTWPPASA